MPKFLDNVLKIKQIKFHYNIKTDTDFAEFLGIPQSTVATWIKRNTLDIDKIIVICPEIDGNWLLTGKGEMLRAAVVASPAQCQNCGHLQQSVIDKERLIASQVVALQAQERSLQDKDYIIATLKEKLQSLEASQPLWVQKVSQGVQTLKPEQNGNVM